MSEPPTPPTRAADTLQEPPLLAESPLLAALPLQGRHELIARAERRGWAAGELMVGELEPGDELLLLLSGRARVTVGSPGAGEERLNELGPGALVGEMALLTGGLRSASVWAESCVEALVLPRDLVQGLMERFPQLARYFLGVLAERLAGTDEVLAHALHPAQKPVDPLERAEGALRRDVTHPRSLRSLVRRAFEELVVEHRRELPFYMLMSFLGGVMAARLTITLLDVAGARIQPVLRAAYVGGVLLVLGAAGVAQLAFRRNVRRWLCVAFGLGAGLVVNELSVLLAFDIFYKDIFTRDARMAFDAEMLYRRSESTWGMVVLMVALAQATYLWRFYRRVYYLVRERLAARSRRQGP